MNAFARILRQGAAKRATEQPRAPRSAPASQPANVPTFAHLRQVAAAPSAPAAQRMPPAMAPVDGERGSSDREAAAFAARAIALARSTGNKRV
jgi:hypothetical protein